MTRKKSKLTGIFIAGAIITLHCSSKEINPAGQEKSKEVFSKENYFLGGATLVRQERNGQKAYLVKGKKKIFSKEKFRIDPEKYYKASVWVKAVGNQPSYAYLGIAPFTEEWKFISSGTVSGIKSTLTKLAASCKASDTVIKVTDGSKWKKGKTFFVAFNAKEDESDLPNFNYTPGIITNIERKNGVYNVTLSKPAGKAYPAGTGVREHYHCAMYIYEKVGAVPVKWIRWQGKPRKGSDMRKGKIGELLLLCNYTKGRKQSMMFKELKTEEIELEESTSKIASIEQMNSLALSIKLLKKEISSIADKDNSLLSYWNSWLLRKLRELKSLCGKGTGEANARQGILWVSLCKDIIVGLKESVIKQEGFITYVVNPMKDEIRNILPDSVSVPGEISNEIKIIGCPGEYEAAGFVMKSVDEIDKVMVASSDLKSPDGKINASAVDIRVVKCWYVGGNSKTSTFYQFAKFPAPELLLKDDSLIKVDTNKKANYIKLVFNRGLSNERIEYRCISDYPDTTKNIARIKQEKSIRWYYWVPYDPEAFPVKDSKELLPVSIPQNTNKQFWITMKIPDDAKPGIYKGKIKISSSKKNYSGELDLKLRVLPFKLSKLPTAQSIYYGGELDLNGKGGVGTGYKSKNPEQYANEMKNLVAHGITNPLFRMTWWAKGNSFDQAKVAKMLEIRRNAGVDVDSIYLHDNNVPIINDPPKIRKVQTAAKKILDFIKSQGCGSKGVYFYGKDEMTGDNIIRQLPLWKAFHGIGGKIFCSGFLRKPTNFELAGDIQDAMVLAHYPSREEAARWHSKGHKIFCYANPQTGLEFPETYRRNYGLRLWQNNYDGGMNNAYMSSYGNPWNDFDCMQNRNETMAYPTVDGVIDTVEWEGYREGVDDWRYLVTLQNKIDDAKKKNAAALAGAIRKAENFLANLKKEDLGKRNLDTIRLEIIDNILALLEIGNHEN
ncbi:MAG: hypothetical protein WCS27_12660 [Victivallaceae bacterium]